MYICVAYICIISENISYITSKNYIKWKYEKKTGAYFNSLLVPNILKEFDILDKVLPTLKEQHEICSPK